MTCYFVRFVIQNRLGRLEGKCDTVKGAAGLSEAEVLNLLHKVGWPEAEYITSYEVWE